MIIFIHQYQSNQFEAKNYGGIVMFIGILIAAIYTIFRFIKVSPSMELNKKFIKFNSTKYYWDDLEEVSINGKKPYLFGDKKEGVMLKFKNQKERCFLDCMYANTPEIKQFIQYQIVEKADSPRAAIKKPDKIDIEQFITYKGVQLFNYRGIILWLVIGALFYGIILKINQPAFLIFFLLLGSTWLLVASWFMYYFSISNSYLLVRNHNLFWIKKIYRLTDIREVVFERQNKMPYCLRIITTDFESKLYPAGTLFDKHWRGLKKDLQKNNIKIREEF